MPGLPDDHEIVGISGTSGGALCATTAWYGLLTDGPEGAAEPLDALWEGVAATNPLERTVNDVAVWMEHLDAMGVPMPSPYDLPTVELVQQYIQRIVEDHVNVGRIPDLVDESTPRLLLSAVDVTEGSFEIFEDEAITPECVVASTAIPTLFPAVEFDGCGYWDGLFSQNPPIRNFLTAHDETDDKPDEIWIVQINPERCSSIPRRGNAISDRRNELAGNLSLEQEIAFIEQVNDWVADGVLPADRYRQGEIERIRLGQNLSYSSKLDTDPSFIDGMLADGKQAAEEFLAERTAKPVTA